jgi:hypothetical protein
MATNDSTPKRGRRTVVLALVAVLTAALAVIALGPLGVAGAQDAKPRGLTSQQKDCLKGHALSFLQDHSGQPISLTLVQAVVQAAPDAAKACGVTLPARTGSVQGALSRLGVSLDQVRCVLSAGVPLPQVAPGQKPTSESLQTARHALVAAAQACGITVPAKIAGAATV